MLVIAAVFAAVGRDCLSVYSGPAIALQSFDGLQSMFISSKVSCVCGLIAHLVEHHMLESRAVLCSLPTAYSVIGSQITLGLQMIKVEIRVRVPVRPHSFASTHLSLGTHPKACASTRFLGCLCFWTPRGSSRVAFFGGGLAHPTGGRSGSVSDEETFIFDVT